VKRRPAGGALSVLAKELREALRDRSLVISLILVPVFLPPLIGFGVFQVLQVIQGLAERETRTVLVGASVPEALRDSLEALDNFVIAEAPDGEWDADSFRALREARADSGGAVPDALLLWHAAPGGSDSATVFYDQARERSSSARDAVTEAAGQWKEDRIREKMSAVGLPEESFELFSVSTEDTATAAETGRRILSAVLPLFLLLMLATGTFYSALDTVVGERERRTLETLLTSPVGRGEILVGKYLFVVVSSLTALLLNLASVTLFLSITLRIAGIEDRIDVSVSPLAVLLIVAAAILTAGFLSAVMMVVAIPSKTYREGQAVLTPVYLLPMIPGIAMSASEDPFGVKEALVPLLNSAALFKSALSGEFPPVPIAITFAVLLSVTAVTLFLASRVVSHEDVFLDPRFTLRQLLARRGTPS
jgi:sodium transport system permease protein